jgi:type IV secretory pathway VirB3-like protein
LFSIAPPRKDFCLRGTWKQPSLHLIAWLSEVSITFSDTYSILQSIRLDFSPPSGFYWQRIVKTEPYLGPQKNFSSFRCCRVMVILEWILSVDFMVWDKGFLYIFCISDLHAKKRLIMMEEHRFLEGSRMEWWRRVVKTMSETTVERTEELYDFATALLPLKTYLFVLISLL